MVGSDAVVYHRVALLQGMMNDTSLALTPAEYALQERNWVSRCRVGDEAALTCLISRHRNRLVRTATNLLRDRHEAEDVAQESFLKAFREIAKLRDDRAFSGFLYRICVRLCMDRLRLKRAEVAEFDRAQPHEGGAVENRVLIEKLLSQLAPELRATLVLREMEQLSYEEVAEVMRVPIGTVRSRLHTARERFRKLWLEAVGE
jgi:RNA polymerase sigma-70 factor, ECF subfamily